jgi:dihydrofolate reductase
MILALVVAAAENGVIGNHNQLPWHLPDDLKHFKAVTMGKPIFMGRRTFEAIGRPLPGRTNVVITRQVGLEIPGCVVVGSVDEGIQRCPPSAEIAVIGGAEIFAQTLPRADVIYLTRVLADIAGDAVFPALNPDEWTQSEIETHEADERHAYPFVFSKLTRIRSKP